MKTARSYTIDQVSQLVSISKSDLRNWEKRYGFPRPERTEGGRRVYSEQEIKKIKILKQHLDSGTPPRKLAQIYESLNDALPVQDLGESSGVFGVQEICESIYSFDARSAQRKLGDLAISMANEDLFQFVYRPLVEKILQDYRNASVPTAASAYASGFLTGRLQYMLNQRKLADSNKYCMVAGARPPSFNSEMPTPLQELAILLNANWTQLSGWNACYLGAQVAIDDFDHIVRAKNPGLCILHFNSSDELRRQLARLGSRESRTIVLLQDPNMDAEGFVDVLPRNVEVVRGSFLSVESL